MKKFLFLFLLVTSFISNSQVLFQTNIITNNKNSWNILPTESPEYSYIGYENRYYSWHLSLNENFTGHLRVRDMVDQDEYIFNIHSFTLTDSLTLNCTQPSTSEYMKIVFSTNEYKENRIAVFMPQSKVRMIFDNIEN